MRVLHLINSLETGGAERLLVDLSSRMQEAGLEVCVLVLKDVDAPLTRELRSLGIRLEALGKGSVYSPLHIFRLRKWLAWGDIVHVHLFPAQYWAALCKAIYRIDTPMLTTEHNPYNMRCNSLLLRHLDNHMYRAFRAVACISPAVQSFMQERLGSQKPCPVVTNGVDVNGMAKRRGKRKELLPYLPEKSFVLMQVARFRAQKDQATVLRALQELPADVHAIFIGEGHTMERNKALAEQLGVGSRAHFLGNRNDVPELLSVADVAVISSHWEGFGLAAVEAMAMELPVAGSRVDGLQQVIGRKELLFEAGNHDELKKLVLHLRNDNDFYQEMATFCSRRATNYDLKQTTQAYISLYNQLTDEHEE